MKRVNDGKHYITDVKRNLTGVLVRPLAPPFTCNIRRFSFKGMDKELAVSEEDAKLIEGLFSGDMKGRHVVLDYGTEELIRVSLSQ